jgi:hypothetical protein
MADAIQIGGFGTSFLADAAATGGAYALIDFQAMWSLVERYGLRLG